MRLTETDLPGAFVVEHEPNPDERGFFARAFDAEIFEAHGMPAGIAQANVAFNHRAGTLRGMHWQDPPASETKLIRCTGGAVHDVIVDLRPDSPTYLRHVGFELSAANRRALFVPELFAHGYLTLADETEVTYQVGARYAPELGRGLRYDDPALGIEWPIDVEVISEKDRSWPLLEESVGLA